MTGTEGARPGSLILWEGSQ